MKILIIIGAILCLSIGADAAVNIRRDGTDGLWYDGSKKILWIRSGSNGLRTGDDLKLSFGDDDDAYIEYDEASSNTLVISGALTFPGTATFSSISVTSSSVIAFTGAATISTASGNLVLAPFGKNILDGETVFDSAPAQIIDASTDTITVTHTYEELSSDAAHTMISTPTIADGTKGQIVYLTEIGSGSVILQDEGQLGSSNLQLGAGTRTIDALDILTLIFNGIYWCEQSYVDN